MDNKIDYEAYISELESIVAKLSTGNCKLDESLELYTRGVFLANECEKRLSEVKETISKVNPATLEEESFEVNSDEL